MTEEKIDIANQRPWALVTGASAGIGAEFCRHLAGRDYNLVLVARRAGKLQALADELHTAHGVDCQVVQADLANPEACKDISEQLELRAIEVEFLVNNAGYGLPGSFHVPQWQEHADFIQVMMTAVCELTWRLLPGMRDRGRGFIVNVASVAGLVPASPGHTLYGASKQFLIRFSESLALENTGNGIKVAALCPGFTYSEFHDVNGTREMVGRLPDYLWLQATDVVRDTLDALDKDRTKVVIIPGRQYRALVFISRHFPWLARWMSNRQSRNYRVTE